jgi:hypothetical protein
MKNQYYNELDEAVHHSLLVHIDSLTFSLAKWSDCSIAAPAIQEHNEAVFANC